MKLNIDSRTITNLTDLMKLIRKLINLSWGKDQVTFTSAYPKAGDSNNLTTPIITYKVKKKLPGKFNTTSEIKPRLREEIVIKNTDLPINGKSLQIWGKMFDYYIEFEVWAENGDQADEVADRFQSFMYKYTGYLKQVGVDRLIFEELNSDESTGQWRTDLINRSIIYHIRIDGIVAATIPTIENVEIETWVHDSMFTMALEIYIRENPEEISI